MFKYGTLPIRNLESFGLAGVLGEKSKVYYDSLFNGRGLGRVSDLVSARLRETGTDELRIRVLLLVTFFAAYRSQAAGAPPATAHSPVTGPLQFEFGMDEEKIGLSFSFPAGNFMNAAGVPQGALADTLAQLQPYADRVIVRVEKDKRVELVALLGIPGKIAPDAAGQKPEATMVQIGGTPAPAPGEYVQMGDMDYHRLLASTESNAARSNLTPGEFLAKGSSELEDALRLRKSAREAPQKVVVQGSGGDLQDRTAVTIEGNGAAPTKEASIMIKGDGAADEAGGSDARLRPYLERIEQLQKELEETRSAALASTPSVAASTLGNLGGLFKKVWPFKRGEPEGEATPASGSAPVATEAAPPAAPVAEAASAEAKVEAPELDPDTPAEMKTLVNEIEAGELEVQRAQEEASEMKRDMQSQRATRWVDGLMSQIVAEKSRLRELARKLSTSVRQKEIEFKARESKLQAELRRRDDTLKQKEIALMRAKEQLSQVTLTLEKTRGGGEKGEEGGGKQKLALTQRLLAGAKEENSKLAKKIEDLKNQLASSQMGQMGQGAKKGMGGNAEAAALKTKYERAQKQADELRGMNEQLTERIQTLTGRLDGKAEPGVTGAETPKKMEAAMKQLSAAQKENEQLKLKLEERQVEENRLKTEIKRYQTEIKSLKASRGKSGSSSAA